MDNIVVLMMMENWIWKKREKKQMKILDPFKQKIFFFWYDRFLFWIFCFVSFFCFFCFCFNSNKNFIVSKICLFLSLFVIVICCSILLLRMLMVNFSNLNLNSKLEKKWIRSVLFDLNNKKKLPKNRTNYNHLCVQSLILIIGFFFHFYVCV